MGKPLASALTPRRYRRMEEAQAILRKIAAVPAVYADTLGVLSDPERAVMLELACGRDTRILEALSGEIRACMDARAKIELRLRKFDSMVERAQERSLIVTPDGRPAGMAY